MLLSPPVNPASFLDIRLPLSSISTATDKPITVGLPSSALATLSALKNEIVLITGGGGFVGSHIVDVFADAGAKVRVFDVVLPAESKRRPGVEYIQGDLLSYDCLYSHLFADSKPIFAVIHVASPSPLSNNAALFERVNVDGTKTLLSACRDAGVRRLVFTSSASVIFGGSDQLNADESTAPPIAALDAYTKSKLAAEKLVLSANDEQLRTISLRPHGIFGPRDPHMMPKMGQVGKTGKSHYMIGDGSNLVDFTYVENVAYAHALAAVKLDSITSPCCGNAYFITNKQPIHFWDFATLIFRGLHFSRLPWLIIPYSVMRPVANVAETLSSIFHFTPTFTRQAVVYAGLHHYYSSAAAERDLDYHPPILLEEALERSFAWFKRLKNPNAQVKTTAAAEETQDTSACRPHKFQDTINQHIIASVLLLLLVWFVFPLVFSSFVCNAVTVAFAFFGLCYYRWSSWGEPLRHFPQSAADLCLSRKELASMTVLITGGNRGCGYESALAFARHGVGRVIITVRDSEKGTDAVKRLRNAFENKRGVAADMSVQSAAPVFSYIVLSTSSFASIRNAVSQLCREGVIVDFLVNNAGAVSGASTTIDGFDEQFQSNYLGSFYLTHVLLFCGRLSSSCRIVHVSSMMHRVGSVDLNDFEWRRQIEKDGYYSPVQFYSNTKLLQTLFSGYFARLCRAHRFRMTSICVHPGTVSTEFSVGVVPFWLSLLVPRLKMFLHALLMKSASDAAETIIYASLSKELKGVSGIYVDNCAIVSMSAQARNWKLAEQVYKKSWQMCGFHEWNQKQTEQIINNTANSK